MMIGGELSTATSFLDLQMINDHLHLNNDPLASLCFLLSFYLVITSLIISRIIVVVSKGQLTT